VTSLLYLVPPCTALMAWCCSAKSLTFAHDGGVALTVVVSPWSSGPPSK
jgi:hypothetical protein